MQGRKGKIKAIDPFSKTGGVVDIYKGKVIDLPPKPSDIEAVSPKIRNLFRPLQPSKKKLEKQEQAQKRKFAHITPIPGESLKAFNRRVDREFLKVRVAERVAAGPLKQASEKRKEFLEEKKKKKKKNASGSDDDDEDNAQASSDKAAAPAGGSQVIGSLRAGAAIADEKALANQVGALVDTFGHHIDHFDSSLHLQTGKKRSKDTWEEDFPRPEKISFLDRAEAPPQIKSIPKYSRSKKAAVAAATGVLPDNTGRAESDAARRRRELKEKEDAEVARKEMVEEARRQKAKEDAIAAYTLMKQKRMEANRAAAVAAAGTAVGRGVVGALRLGGNL